ncbi:unnamed protein product [Caenorhabditis angaria]|uniref:Uncharacterized protein n=1 Tax=Caenorhabditis angaria TaxID=860376 RepID=A0A9P1N2K8_9PELO|nr:unnamed protein product [Caenorhabditis angaria]
MNKNDCMFRLHNTDTTKEIISAAVNAFCDMRTDACLSIDLNFERCIRTDSITDTFSRVKIEVLKAEDYRAPVKPALKWSEDDQNWISKCGAGGSIRKPTKYTKFEEKPGKPNHSADFFKEEPEEKLILLMKKRKPEKHRAIFWEIPSAEVYAVRFSDFGKRKVNFRKSATDVRTAQEVPAVREKGDSSDATDNDATLLKTDGLSRESASEDSTLVMKSRPVASVETVVTDELLKEVDLKQEPPKKIVPKREFSIRESKREPEKEKSKETSEKAINTEEKPKEIADKSVNTEAKEEKIEPKEDKAVNTEEKVEPEKPKEIKAVNTEPKSVFIPSVRRRADAGDLTILEIENGITKFTASTRHLHRKKPKFKKSASRK